MGEVQGIRSIIGRHKIDGERLIMICRGPASAGLRVPKGWTAQAKNEGSDTKFDAGERPALVGLTELSEFNQALFL